MISRGVVASAAPKGRYDWRERARRWAWRLRHPDPIVLQVGEPVQFKVSSADTRHLLVIQTFGIGLDIPQKSLNEAVTTEVVTPQEVRTFQMFCRIHERLPMAGTLEVRETGAASH